jgi:hypothetical protein
MFKAYRILPNLAHLLPDSHCFRDLISKEHLPRSSTAYFKQDYVSAPLPLRDTWILNLLYMFSRGTLKRTEAISWSDAIPLTVASKHPLSGYAYIWRDPRGGTEFAASNKKGKMHAVTLPSLKILLLVYRPVIKKDRVC